MKRVLRWGQLVIVSCVMATTTTAYADALSPPPACPPGAKGQSTHAGLWCAPAPCTSDEQCRTGNSCRNWRVCIRKSDSFYNRRNPVPLQIDVVVGSCDPAQKCSGEDQPPPPMAGTVASGRPECTVGKYCVPPTLPPLPSGKNPGAAGDGDDDPKGQQDHGEQATDKTGRPLNGGRNCRCELVGQTGNGYGSWLAILTAMLLVIRRRP